MAFHKAERKKGKLRLMIYGGPGFGKTFSSILIASGMGNNIGLIGTERGSEELYGDIASYQVSNITPPYDPQKFIEELNDAEKQKFDVVIIDSFSHAWMGEGGVLDIHNAFSKSQKNPFSAWKDATPFQNKLMDRILSYPGHIICCVRAKTGYTVGNDNKITKKTTLDPIQRPGTEYEFRIVFEMSDDHYATAVKDIGIFGSTPFVPTKETGKKILDWLETGSSIEELPMSQNQSEEIRNMKEKIDCTPVQGKLIADWFKTLNFDQAQKVIVRLREADIFTFSDYESLREELKND